MIRTFSLIIILVLINLEFFGQDKKLYYSAYEEIHSMLKNEKTLDFKRAVFLTENAFYDGKLNYSRFCEQIDSIKQIIITLARDNNFEKQPMGKQYSIFSYLIEPTKYNNNQKYKYDFEDFLGTNDWASMFVFLI